MAKDDKTRPAWAGSQSGTSLEDAIVIEADVSTEGIALEYRVLRERFPEWDVTGQGLVQSGSKIYDVLELHRGRETLTVYFDITRFFGRHDPDFFQP